MTILYLGPKGINARVFRRDEISDSLIGYAFPFHYFDFHNTFHTPLEETGAPRTKLASLRRQPWPWLKLLSRTVAVRCASYLPIPALRRLLVKKVNRDLQLQFVHLEASVDMPLADVLAGGSGSSAPPGRPPLWSLLYLKAGSVGLERIRRGLALLDDTSESGRFAQRWLDLNTKCIRRQPEGSAHFEVVVPLSLSARDTPGPVTYVRCDEVRFCRVHDYYDEHNPWLLFVCEFLPTRTETEVVIFTAKDTHSHQVGMVSQWVDQ